MKTNGTVKVRLYSFLNLALGGVWSVPPTGRFITGERVPGTQWIADWVVASEPIWVLWRKVPRRCWELNEDSLVFQPVAQSLHKILFAFIISPILFTCPTPYSSHGLCDHFTVQQVVLKDSKLVEKSFCSCVTRTFIAFITKACTRQYWALARSFRVGGPGEWNFGRPPRPDPGILPVLNGGNCWRSTAGKWSPWRAKQGNCTVTLIWARYRAVLESEVEADDGDVELWFQPRRSNRVHST